MRKKKVLSKFMILCWAARIPRASGWTPLVEQLDSQTPLVGMQNHTATLENNLAIP